MAGNSILWAGRTLHGTDRFGRWVTLRGQFEGWWDSPEIKGQTVNREDADGEFDLPIYNQARLVTIGGHVHAPSRRELREARNFLAGPMVGRLQVTDEGSTQWADAKRTSPLRFVTLTPTFAQWQITLKCTDPRKFGELYTFAASVGSPATAFHWGNYVAMPRFTVAGSMPGGYTLWIQGVPFVVTRPLWSTDPHTIDYDDGRLRIGGVVIHGGLGVTNTPGVQPGGSALIEITPLTTGTATATMTLLDTFI